MLPKIFLDTADRQVLLGLTVWLNLQKLGINLGFQTLSDDASCDDLSI